MANMSYCRWRNTRADLMDCLDAFDNLNDGYEMSGEEVRAAKMMIRSMCEFLQNYEVIEDFDCFHIFHMLDQMQEEDEEE